MFFNPFLTRVFSVVLCLSNLLFTGVIYGQEVGDYRSAQSGNWKVAANWEFYNGHNWVVASDAPDKKSGVITIRNGDTITILEDRYIDQTIVEDAGVIVLDCEVTSSVTNLLVVDGPGPGPDLLVKGTFINRDGRVINRDVPNNVTGTVEFTANSTYNHNKNGGYIPTATWDVTSTCLVTGYANSPMEGFNQTFGNFTWDCSLNGSLFYIIPSSGMSIAGNFTVLRTGNGSLLRDYYLEVDQEELLVGGDLILIGGALKIGANSSANNKSSKTFNVKGDVIIEGGTLLISSGSKTGILNVAGNFIYNGGTITSENTQGGNIIFNGTQPQIYSTGPKAIISSKINFTVRSGAILQMADESTYVRGDGYFNLMAGATLGITSPFGINLNNPPSTSNYGNILVKGTRTYNAQANYIYNGKTYQTTGNGLTTAQNLIIDNASGVTLSQQVNVNGVLTLANGQLISRTTTTTETVKLLILNDGATVSGGSSTSFVNGPIKKVGDEKFVFPVGKNGNYMPIEISSPTYATDAFTAEYFSVNPPNWESITSQELLKVSNCEYWTLDRSSGNSDVNITLKWDRNKDCNGGEFFSDPLTIVVAHYNTSSKNWNIHGGIGISDENGGFVTWEKVPEYGILTFGKTLPSLPLPVKFSSVRAFKKSMGVQVEFTNLTESDVDHYEIERSIGGQAFFAVKKLLPVKNDYGTASYVWLDDKKIEGRVVYRIKAVETTGKIIYSNLLNVTLDALKTSLNVFAKSGQVVIQINSLPAGEYQFSIVNAVGLVVLTEKIHHEGGKFSQAIPLLNAKTGVYIFCVQGSVQMQLKFLLQ